MSSLIHKISHFLSHLFTANNLTAAEKFVADALPVFGADLAKFSDTLPAAHDSLFALAAEAQRLYQDAKGQPLNFSLATHLAQSVITSHWPEIVAEAEKLLGK